MAKRNQDVHFLASKEEVDRIHQKMTNSAYEVWGLILEKWLWMVIVSILICKILKLWFPLRICSNNLNQYAKGADETGSIYKADINDLQERLEDIWMDMKKVLVRLSSIQ